MHLYLYPRGIKDRSDLWVSMAQNLFWQWERKSLATGKMETSLVQGSLRPTIWGAYEYIFPEECLAEVLAVFGVFSNNTHKKVIFMRPFFNCRKIPNKVFDEVKKIITDIKVTGTRRGLASCTVRGVALEVIGIKKDERKIWKEAGYEQELL